MKMNKRNVWFAALLLAASILLAGCGGKQEHQTEIGANPPLPSMQVPAIDSTENESGIKDAAEGRPVQDNQNDPLEKEAWSTQEDIPQKIVPTAVIPTPATAAVSLDSVIPYSGNPFIIINDNVPGFSENEFTLDSFEFYSELDNLGRCGTAYANVGQDIMPAEERGAIGQVKPSGWHTVRYNGVVDGNYLYNRCHLLGYQLTAENANTRNLITGTRYMNVQGMLPFENMVADYVRETDDHVLYRVTPIFDGDNLVASGVQMEAMSVGDGGESIQFNVFCYNVQPGIEIDYATGESKLADSAAPESASEVNKAEQVAPAAGDVGQEAMPSTVDYVLNTNTKKFHYPSCASVKNMKDKNKEAVTASRDDVIAMGYVPCKNCNP